MKITILFMCFLLSPTFAADTADKNIYVHTLGDFDGSSLKKDGVVVKRGISAVSYTEDLPTPSEMTGLLVKAGLNEITDWDQFDLDVLSVRLKTKPFERVVAKYPKLDPRKLQKYKKLLEERT